MIQLLTNNGLSIEAVCEALDVSGLAAGGHSNLPQTGGAADARAGFAVCACCQTSHRTDTGGTSAPNRLNQDFRATYPNKKWFTDTTYIPTNEGWLYLVSVMDLYSRQVVSWAMGERHDAFLPTSALDMAIQRQRPAPGLIVHSDRGSEFANARFYQRSSAAQIQLSMSSTGNCYDNAAAESFFATVKLEAVRGLVFVSRAIARQELFDFIEVFYNRQRLHSGLRYVPPVNRAA